MAEPPKGGGCGAFIGIVLLLCIALGLWSVIFGDGAETLPSNTVCNSFPEQEVCQ